MRRLALLVVGVALVALIGWWWPIGGSPARPPAERASTDAVTERRGGAAGAPAPSDSRENEVNEFPLAARLNIPSGTLAQDLDALSQILDAWRSNFPGQGNPWGENSEITAALAGQNSLGLVLIPKSHRALNVAGELCDRWGTPFRFHQLSGQQMEIRSAGPDRKFATLDDGIWHPPE